ncbi:MAG: tail fiber protein [Bacteroidetes bacterium]|nr:tail fiber protein [Bacteroidota bacterium]
MDESLSYLAEVKLFAGTFAPRNWALCDGKVLKVSEWQALFSLIGTLYGGDGKTTFALPGPEHLPSKVEGEGMKYIICMNGNWPQRQ